MSIGNSGQSAAEVYADIIDLPHHEPKTRMRMPRSNRAASFSPFAALSGYDDAVKETARLTDRQIEIGEDTKIALNERLRIAMEQIENHPVITVTYFMADSRKNGGACTCPASPPMKSLRPFRRRRSSYRIRNSPSANP